MATELGGRGADIVGQDELLEPNIISYPDRDAFEADDVGGVGVTRVSAENAAERARANIAVPVEQAHVVVQVELSGGWCGCGCHGPYLTPWHPGRYG